jgi:hypothetical protein
MGDEKNLMSEKWLMFESMIQHLIAVSLCNIAQQWNSRQGSEEYAGIGNSL